MMNSIRSLSAALLLGLIAKTPVAAQTFVTQSPIVLASTIITQGTDAVTQSVRDGTFTTRRVVSTPYTNREVLAAMIDRRLIGGVPNDFLIVFLQDASGAGGLYAQQKNTAVSVPVPTDLLTLPAFGPSVTRGTETTTARGNFLSDATTTALATSRVNSIPVTGLASSGFQTLTTTLNGLTYEVDTVTSSFAFNGGTGGFPSTRLITGTIFIGNGKISPLPSLP